MDEPRTCPVCKEPCDSYEVSFSKEGTWCNHAGWVLKTGLTSDDPPILGDAYIGRNAPPTKEDTT